MRKILFTLSLLVMLNACKDAKVADNPFFAEFETANGVPPFDKIKTEHYLPAFEEGLRQKAEEVEAITNNVEPATFENTIEALDKSGQMLSRVSSVFYGMKSSNSTDEIEDIAKTLSPMLSKSSDDIYLNNKLFDRIKTVYNNGERRKTMNQEQNQMVEEYFKDFVSSGIMLNEEEKTRLREINEQLGKLTLEFGKNVSTDTKSYELVIDNKDNLAGLPEDVVKAASEQAEAKGKAGKWVFTLDQSSWIPFLTYADNRELREELYKAMYNRGNNNNESDNKANINKIVNLRLERANLLGFKSFADQKLDRTMAKTPEKAMALLNSVWEYALPQAKRELADMQNMAKKEGMNKSLESWDWWYYAEKVRKEKYTLDEEAIKPYFMADNVREGVFAVANKLYGISFKERADLPTYHPDAKAFEVTDKDGSYIGIIYLDYYTRNGKKVGAWMSSFRKQSTKDGEMVHPIIYNVGNFNPPVGDKPSLLSLDQVETMFHEFGHGLHGLLSNCTYNSLSGTSVARDFVELPSQILEHWAFEPQVLKMYAKHYQTGEVIPDEIIKKIENATYFNQGFRTTEFVAAAILDMKWHMVEKKADFDVAKFEADAMNEIGLISQIIPRYRSTYFLHIFNGGYSAGYYGYMWAEVLDSDAFQAFVEAGDIFDQKTAQSFRDNVLSRGGTEDPMVLYKKFRGAEPDATHLLRNRGFVK